MNKPTSKARVDVLDRALSWLERLPSHDIGLLGVSALSVGLMILVFKGLTGTLQVVLTSFLAATVLVPIWFVIIKLMRQSIRGSSLSPSSAPLLPRDSRGEVLRVPDGSGASTVVGRSESDIIESHIRPVNLGRGPEDSPEGITR